MKTNPATITTATAVDASGRWLIQRASHSAVIATIAKCVPETADTWVSEAIFMSSNSASSAVVRLPTTRPGTNPAPSLPADTAAWNSCRTSRLMRHTPTGSRTSSSAVTKPVACAPARLSDSSAWAVLPASGSSSRDTRVTGPSSVEAAARHQPEALCTGSLTILIRPDRSPSSGVPSMRTVLTPTAAIPTTTHVTATSAVFCTPPDDRAVHAHRPTAMSANAPEPSRIVQSGPGRAAHTHTAAAVATRRSVTGYFSAYRKRCSDGGVRLDLLKGGLPDA